MLLAREAGPESAVLALMNLSLLEELGGGDDCRFRGGGGAAREEPFMAKVIDWRRRAKGSPRKGFDGIDTGEKLL